MTILLFSLQLSVELFFFFSSFSSFFFSLCQVVECYSDCSIVAKVSGVFGVNCKSCHFKVSISAQHVTSLLQMHY